MNPKNQSSKVHIPYCLARWYWKNNVDFLPNPQEEVNKQIKEYNTKFEYRLQKYFDEVPNLYNGWGVYD